MNTWDEKNYTKPKSNCLNNNEQEPSDTTKITKSDSTQPQWKDIGGVKKWKRQCPTCKKEVWATRKDNRQCKACAYATRKTRSKRHYTKKELTRICRICKCKISYSNIQNKRKAERNNSICLSCHGTNSIRLINKIPKSKSTKQKISLAALESYKNNPNRQKGKNNSMYGKHRFGVDNPNYGKRWSFNKREKMRIYWAEQYKLRGYQISNYNKVACKYFDTLSSKMNWKLQHAENGGEYTVLGYFLDSYDKKRNIVVEYDEPHHFSNSELKKKDVDRMNKIIHHLKCKFYRYRESTQELIKYA